MNKAKKLSSEVREHASRPAQEHRGKCPSLWAAVGSIAPKIGCVPQTPLDWGKRKVIDSVTTAEPQRLEDL
jgi:transposase